MREGEKERKMRECMFKYIKFENSSYRKLHFFHSQNIRLNNFYVKIVPIECAFFWLCALFKLQHVVCVFRGGQGMYRRDGHYKTTMIQKHDDNQSVWDMKTTCTP